MGEYIDLPSIYHEYSTRLNPGKAIFLSSSGNEFYYEKHLCGKIRSVCVVKVVASKEKEKWGFPDETSHILAINVTTQML